MIEKYCLPKASLIAIKEWQAEGLIIYLAIKLMVCRINNYWTFISVSKDFLLTILLIQGCSSRSAYKIIQRFWG